MNKLEAAIIEVITALNERISIENSHCKFDTEFQKGYKLGIESALSQLELSLHGMIPDVDEDTEEEILARENLQLDEAMEGAFSLHKKAQA